MAKRRKLGTRPDDDQEINLALDLRLFGLEHRELQSSNTHYANCCSFMLDSGIRPFRFIGIDCPSHLLQAQILSLARYYSSLSPIFGSNFEMSISPASEYQISYAL